LYRLIAVRGEQRYRTSQASRCRAQQAEDERACQPAGHSAQHSARMGWVDPSAPGQRTTANRHGRRGSKPNNSV